RRAPQKTERSGTDGARLKEGRLPGRGVPRHQGNFYKQPEERRQPRRSGQHSSGRSVDGVEQSTGAQRQRTVAGSWIIGDRPGSPGEGLSGWSDDKLANQDR